MAKNASARRKRHQKKDRPVAPSASRSKLKPKKKAPRDLGKNRKAGYSNKAAKTKKSSPKKAKPSAAEVVFVDSYELPVRYGRTGVTLIARDPHSVYAYWEITPSSLLETRTKLGASFKKSTRTLRMFDVTDIDFDGTNANRQFDVDIDAKAQNRYIILPNDNATLCADLGFKTRGGEFYPLARSNFISTPSADASNQSEITWAKVRHREGSKPYVVAQAVTPALEGWEDVGREQEVSVAADLGEIRPMKEKSHEDDATEESERNEHDVLVGEELEQEGEYDGSAAVAQSEEISEVAQTEDYLNESAITPFPALNSSFEMGKNAFSADLLYSSSDIAGGASEQMQRKRDFFFHLDSDLIVYGRTEPGARVTLNDHTVDLREDGTFTQRLAFPDGTLPLDFTARPPDGSITKTIMLTAKKSTTVYL